MGVSQSMGVFRPDRRSSTIQSTRVMVLIILTNQVNSLNNAYPGLTTLFCSAETPYSYRTLELLFVVVSRLISLIRADSFGSLPVFICLFILTSTSFIIFFAQT